MPFTPKSFKKAKAAALTSKKVKNILKLKSKKNAAAQKEIRLVKTKIRPGFSPILVLLKINKPKDRTITIKTRIKRAAPKKPRFESVFTYSLLALWKRMFQRVSELLRDTGTFWVEARGNVPGP